MDASVTVHLGAHKTASSHLQRTLRRQQTMLEASGVAVMLPRVLRKELPVPALSAGRLSGDADALEAARVAFREAAGQATHVLMSDENILGSAHGAGLRKTGTFYPEAHGRLYRMLTGFGISGAKVCLAVRDPAGFVVSAYSQRVVARGFTPFTKFLGGIDVCTLAWSELIERLAGTPGVEQVSVWRYEDYPRVAREAFRHLLPPHAAASMVPLAGVQHSGLSADAHAVMAQLHENGEKIDAERAGALRRTLPKGDGRPGFSPLSPGLRAESARYYEEDLADIAAMDGVTVLSP